MQVILFNSFKKNVNFFHKELDRSLRFNKTLRFNFCNKNFLLYKYNNKKFCDKNLNSDNIQNVESKDFMDSEKLVNLVHKSNSLSDVNIIEEIEKIDLDQNKQVILKNYGDLKINREQDLDISDDINSKLPVSVKTKTVEGEEVEIFIPDKNISKVENFENYKQFLARKDYFENQFRNHKLNVGVAMFICFLFVFSLWIPLYKTICESQGFAVKTHNVDYKFDGKKLNVMKKFTVKFVKEVDPELPWSFEPLQNKVVLNAGETCLIFYRARNLTDEPLIGLSVYDVHPASISFYFNKIQCFCFENQMLGPREEVDLPVFFYIDPAINDAPDLDEYREFVLKYSFYLAKKQDLAKVMSEHLKKEKEEREKLNNLKRELNKQGKNYKIEEENKFTGLPGINPELAEFIIQENEKAEQEEKI